MVREVRVFISPAGVPAYGVGYYVQALEVGAQVTAASSGLTATVASGHGLAADDKVIVGTDITQYRIVDSVTDTTVVFTETIQLAEGDLLVNLADDSGSIAPNFDGAGLTVYTDMDYTNAATYNTVLTDSFGLARYYHTGTPRWELVRSSTGPIAIYTDTGGSSSDTVVHNVQAFGAKGDGVTDDAAAIQAAIDATTVVVGVGRGGEVFFPPGNYRIKSTINLKPFVKLRGLNYSGIRDVFSFNSGVTIAALAPFTGTAMFETVVDSQYWGIEICDMRIIGNLLVEDCIVLNGTKMAKLHDLALSECTQSAVKLLTGSVVGSETTLSDIQATQFNSDIVGVYRGVYQIDQTDCYVHNCRAGGNGHIVTTYASGGFQVGFNVTSTGNFISNSYADFNETGWVISGQGNNISNCRADHNLGQGFVVTSAVGSGALVGCYAANNSQAATNTYDAFYCASQRCSFVGCQVVFNGVTNTHRYAYNQVSSFAANNMWIGCSAMTQSYGTALFNDTNAAGGWELQKSIVFASANSATPSILNAHILVVGSGNTVLTRITQLLASTKNQIIRIINVNGATPSYILNSGDFTLKSGNWFPGADEWIELVTLTTGNTWREIGRTPAPTTTQVSALIPLSTGGTTTDTAGLLPANSLILGVSARVITTIATATSWQLGISGTPGRFTTAQSGAQLTAGATVVGMEHLRGDSVTLNTGPTQAAAADLRITTVGTPSAGAIRVTVNYIPFTAPPQTS